MRILILGGTVFLGRHLVEAALERGHEVTLFNRGQHNPELFEDVEKLRGDRDGDLAALRGRSWDVAIDTCGYVPRVVSLSVEALRDAVEHYTFVSSLSVFADKAVRWQAEDAPVCLLDDVTVEEITGETYGGLKALCEEVTRAGFPDRGLVVRPGLIVGPEDQTDRFTYWPVKVASQSAVLAPPPDTILEFVDVRDLAGWILHAAESRFAGLFNVSGPRPKKSTFRELLETCVAVSEGDPEIHWATVDFLLENEVGPWIDLPLWLTPDSLGFATRDTQKAVDHGLRFRPIEDTVRDTLSWARARANPELGTGLCTGLDPKRERELIARWKDAASQS